MKTTTRRAALVASAGVTAAIGSALTAAPASAEDPVTVMTDVTQTFYCGEVARPIGDENGALARVTTTCDTVDGVRYLRVTGSIDDTEQDGRSACVSFSWPNDAGYERARDTQDDNLVTRFPSGWRYKGDRVSVHVWTCA